MIGRVRYVLFIPGDAISLTRDHMSDKKIIIHLIRNCKLFDDLEVRGKHLKKWRY